MAACGFLRLPKVIAKTGKGRSSIYLDVSQGRFPRPISIGARAVAWIEEEVDAWMAERVSQSRPEAAKAE